MTTNFKRIFKDIKPVIGMVHIGALPGTPLFDPSVDLLAAARADLIALQNAGFDAVMFGNENDRPYEFDVDTASTATMAAIIGQLKPEITVPFGVNLLWDPMSSVALGAATGAAFVRETHGRNVHPRPCVSRPALGCHPCRQTHNPRSCP